MSTEFRLCYVDPPWAYFADRDPTEVWGDDWNDAPHDCNAGTPYGKDERSPDRPEIVKVAWAGQADLWLVGAGNFGGYVRDRYGWLSVEQINHGDAPWLVELAYGKPLGIATEIHAGTTLEEFKVVVWCLGGDIYKKAEAPVAASAVGGRVGPSDGR